MTRASRRAHLLMMIITHSVKRTAVLVQPDVILLVRHEPVMRTSAMRNTSGQVVPSKGDRRACGSDQAHIEHLRAAFASPITLFTIIVGS
jgi:hypothetical protein